MLLCFDFPPMQLLFMQLFCKLFAFCSAIGLLVLMPLYSELGECGASPPFSCDWRHMTHRIGPIGFKSVCSLSLSATATADTTSPRPPAPRSPPSNLIENADGIALAPEGIDRISLTNVEEGSDVLWATFLAGIAITGYACNLFTELYKRWVVVRPMAQLIQAL